MEKQVPEGNERGQQLAELLEVLRGNRIFGELRRKNNQHLLAAIDEVLAESKTPSEFNQRWERLSGRLRVVGHLMATLKRDGKTEALAALRGALADPLYVFPGETIASERTAPMTLVMFSPAATFAMLRWIKQGNFRDLDAIVKLESIPADDASLVATMFRHFPSLKKAVAWRREWHPYEGCDLGYAYQVDVLRKVRIPSRLFHPLGLRHSECNGHIEISPPNQAVVGAQIEPDSEEIKCWAYFAFWAAADQREVLSGFSREQQRDIATWQFHVPADYLTWTRAGVSVGVGLHPEAEHEALRHEYGWRASAGVSQGFGAVINMGDPVESYPKDRYEDKERFVFSDIGTEGWTLGKRRQ